MIRVLVAAARNTSIVTESWRNFLKETGKFPGLFLFSGEGALDCVIALVGELDGVLGWQAGQVVRFRLRRNCPCRRSSEGARQTRGVVSPPD